MRRSTADVPKLGDPVPNWHAPDGPNGVCLSGQHVVLHPLDPDAHAEGLHGSFDGHDQVWDYLPYGPFATVEQLHAWMRDAQQLPNHQFFVIEDRETGRLQGVASYLRIAPQNGSIEVGHLNFSPVLQSTTAATEAMYLMMQWAFNAGYRRYDWKCNALNLASRRAAQRLGLSFEGVFRQATVSKGRNRDTAWFAAIDAEWPALDKAFRTWLAPDNFVSGRQKVRLSDLTDPILVSRDPALT